MKTLVRDFNANVERKDIFKPIIRNDSIHEASNNNGIRVVNFATSNNPIFESTIFPHSGIHKHTWTSHDGVTRNQIDQVLIDKRRH
jgi:hypothetical protein